MHTSIYSLLLRAFTYFRLSWYQYSVSKRLILLTLFTDVKLEFFDDVYAEHEDSENHNWHKYNRGAGILMAVIAAFFLASVL